LEGKLKDLIKIDTDAMICGKKLHEFLQIGSRFDIWARRRIEELRFSQPIDFIMIKNDRGEINSLRFSIDAAKHIGMVEKNERGFELRQYLIEAEKELRSGRKIIPMTPAMIILEQSKQLVEQERLLAEHSSRLTAVENRMSLVAADSHYRTVRGLANALGLNIPRDAANAIGRKAASICRSQGHAIGKVPDERDGTVNSYPITVLEPVIKAWQSGVL
jgi:phage anti-repressor protein